MQAFILKSLVDYINVKVNDIWKGNLRTRRGILIDWAYPFARVARYKRGSDIPKGDIAKVRYIIAVEKKSSRIAHPPNQDDSTADLETKVGIRSRKVTKLASSTLVFPCPIILIYTTTSQS